MIQKEGINMVSVIILMLLPCSFVKTSAQAVTTANLDSCINWAVKNYPLYKHAQLVQKQSDNTIKEINNDMLPQLSVEGQATYQSETMAFEMEGLPPIGSEKDNYSFGLHLEQVLCDFGKNSQSKAVERAQAATNIQRNEVDLYQLRSTIMQLYSQILLTKENVKILHSYIDNINEQYKDLKTAVENGVALQSNLNILYAEMQRTNQRLINANSDLISTEQTLNLYTHTNFDTTTSFAPIKESALFRIERKDRPELTLFDSQIKALDEEIKMQNRNKTPRIYLFGEGAYGRPGYDMTNTDLRLYGTIGVGLRWNLNDFFKNKYKSRNLAIDKNMVEEQRALFEIRQNSELIKKKNDIERYKKLVDTDADILDKYTTIITTAADQLENGIITSTDYLTQLHAQKQAELNQQIHIVQLQLAAAEYYLTAGTK